VRGLAADFTGIATPDFMCLNIHMLRPVLLLWSTVIFSLCAFAHGDLHERIAAVTAQIQTNPASPGLWLQRADLHRQHGEFAAAKNDLDHAAQLKPGWPAAHLQRARISFDTEKFSDCELAATACLNLEPTNADALVLRARSLVQLKEFTRAAADYDAVLDATNSAAPLPDLYLERARAHAAVENWDAAIHGLDAGMKRIGATPSLALPAIEFERQRGAFDTALERLDRAKGFFNDGSYTRLRGEILKQAGRQ
jgi:tetratricopeptide (TPR) repeat protein